MCHHNTLSNKKISKIIAGADVELNCLPLHKIKIIILLLITKIAQDKKITKFFELPYLLSKKSEVINFKTSIYRAVAR